MVAFGMLIAVFSTALLNRRNFQVNDTIIEGLNFFVHRWGAKEVVIGENGLALFNSDKLSPSQQINDGARIDWYRNTFRQIDIILKEGKIDLKGFVPWSCISNFGKSMLNQVVMELQLTKITSFSASSSSMQNGAMDTEPTLA